MLDADEEKVIDEEAIAEEEFVADLEDTIENPLVFDGDKVTVESKKDESASKPEREELPGAVGTGDLIPEEKPFNNEEALRSENVNNDQNPFSPDSPSEKGFGGPDVAPLEDAAETIAPAASTTATAEGATEASTSNPFADSAEKPSVAQSDNNTDSGASLSSTDATESTGGGIFASTEPAPVVNATTESAAPTVQDLANDANKPKKKKTGLIVGIILVILLLGLIGGGIAFYLIHESKERVVSDSIANLIEADARQFDGTLTETNLDSENESFKSFTLTFKADNNSANFSGVGSLKIKMKKGKDVELDVSGAYITNDAIYIKIDGIKKAVENALEEAIASDDVSKDEAALIKDIVGAIADPLDDEWIKIKADDLKSYKQLKDGYDCMAKALDSVSEKGNKEKIIEAYKSHPFIMNDDKDGSSSDGLNYYYVKSDSEESKAFSEELEKIDFVKDFKSCSDSKSSTSKDDDDKKDSDEVTSEMSFGITPWSHELKHVKGTAESKKMKFELDIKISYDNKSVAAPTSDAKTLEDVVEDMAKEIKTALSGQIESMCKEYKAYGQTMYEYCIEQYTKSFEEAFDIGNLLNTGGGIINTSAQR